MLNNIRIVLVNTSDQRNIGSAARAMKTMGISDLVLVAPEEIPEGKAQALAAGATDVLANARYVETLDEAIADCQLVMATSARNRTLDWPMLDPREAGEKAVEEGAVGKVALVFGREASGLTNEELQKSQFHTHIPANPEYSSLNLAMAVQTLSYEVRMAWLNTQKGEVNAEDGEDYPNAQDLEGFYGHLEKCLGVSGFIVRKHPGQIMNKLRRLFTRARPSQNELNILRGILASFERLGDDKSNKESGE
ncbi:MULTISPECIES: tRNA (cytosine(32)/uridine(32)-2'-O)-methyltransferase TrmJ [Gammaproteobacteria]|uniref:tRNA (cytosine(32)/uridine(32)-2'-O)-methyltransferase TrmJ n=1 Tax=Gammaproteobacteria TaxID=1236 RepID=UPI000DD0A7C6|nr:MULTISPECIES: tRNA (cytosine(32)/uridine(32)-2'-O)-methyltransferase TrmJ [Gammaproteobacteria]RTE86218.1 tRNA (cytosine(32)/uridine(32)-2'-O)-methyltransferase TrmJ [Aliidiomarina sp. B3213]TCZ91569.1 tRNA (cytosine(32)/uridine(32)-2'-O)-methyltransferase TrmJ [Lysobacter sp. N42]